MFLGDFMETFGTTRSATSMIASTQMGVTNIVGPIAAYLVKRFGCREIAIAGSTIAATSIIVSGAAPNLATLYITAGLFTGNLCNLNLVETQIVYIYSYRCGFWLHLPTSHCCCGNLL